MALVQNENAASDSIPSFLLKTYEILEVVLISLRTSGTVTLFVGQGQAKAL